ncbi:MAG: erythromycin esterase family protein, partial [Oligoflexia bacterium]|nr:erythromycin esterase family protein [Oligoflexia bacterium]
MTATAVSEALKPTSFTVDEVRDLQPLMERLSSARVVLLGESTHGTEEFYQWRRLITQWLITKHGFTMIAVEGDWPLARKIHRYIRGREGDHARGVLEGNHRWPTWVWANTEVIRLLEWLRSHNARPDVAEPVSFCGLDMYS